MLLRGGNVFQNEVVIVNIREGETSMPYRSRRCPAISRADIEMILSSNPWNRRWYSAISYGAKPACRSRGTSMSISPVSTIAVLQP